MTDRPTKAHEYVFMLTKSPRYFFDQEAVREAFQPSTVARDAYGYNHAFASQFKRSPTDERHQDGKKLAAGAFTRQQETLDGSEGEAPRGADGRRKTTISGTKPGEATHENYANREGKDRWPNGGRNIRSVWEIATQPYPEAHFATFPEALPERCIKAGCPEQVCRTCGKPRERIVERTGIVLKEPAIPIRERRGDAVNDKRTALSGTQVAPATSLTVGWSDCGHDDWRAGRVLDPFMGSGTTAYVARNLGRHALGIELNETYAALCARRLQQLSLLA